MTTDTALEIGTEFLGYRIDELIGRGGMGIVYRAYDRRLKRTVALKFVAPELARDARFRERFLRETELAASLEHPNVVPIHDAGEVDGRLYLAMRFVDGTDLAALLRAEQPLELGRALAISGQVARALDAAHASGLVHRDVKPSNVLLDAGEHAYLADFGLTRRLIDNGGAELDGRSLGTPAYVAPEQLDGRPVDGRADVYSLACLIFECVTGEPPFPLGSRLAVAWAHLEEEPPGASARNPLVPAALDDVLGKGLAKDTADRPPTCTALITAAEAALGLGKPRRPRWRIAVLATAAAMVAGLAAVGGAVALRADRANATNVAVVIPRESRANGDASAPYMSALMRASRRYDIDTETLVVDPANPQQFDAVATRLKDFDLVLVGGTAAHELLARQVRKNRGTRFVFIDPHPNFDTKPLAAPNFNDIFFVEGPASHLAGYLAALVEQRRAKAAGMRDVVISFIGGNASVSENFAEGFKGGASAAVPLAVVLEDYSHTFTDPAVCERIANRQIAKGSRVVFAAAGTCSQGALTAAGIQGVWGIGNDVDRSYLGRHILASVVKRRDRAVDYAIRTFLDGSLVGGRLQEIGIERDATGIVGISRQVPREIRRKLAKVAERLRAKWAPASAP